MQISEKISLKPFNTFGLDVTADRMIEVFSEEELRTVLHDHEPEDLLLLGGGSNILLTRNIEKTVLKISLHGKQLVSSKENCALVCAGAGENWHAFVCWTLDHNLGGLENLSLIPGNVGAAPIQNIGAYGVELKDLFHHLEAMDLRSGEKRDFSRDQCAFGYRDSLFKREAQGRYVITKVYLNLTSARHDLHTSYGELQDQLKEKGVGQPTIQDVSEAVIRIRESKLPDPKDRGNSGSFFKNPIIPKDQFEKLQARYPDIASYTAGIGSTKVAAGWLIEKAGWKGYREGDSGVHEKQALVLVNYGNAKGGEIRALSQNIQRSVKDRFGIELETEVRIL